MKFINYIRRALAEPSAAEMAVKELESARKSYLEAHSAKEYAASMVTYHESRIRRLSNYINTEGHT